MSATVTRLVSIDTTFLDKHKPGVQKNLLFRFKVKVMKVQVKLVESKTSILMTKNPTTVKERVTANTRVPQDKDALTKSIKRNNM
jgi:hypothetical protein